MPSKPQPQHVKYQVPPWDNRRGLGALSAGRCHPRQGTPPLPGGWARERHRRAGQPGNASCTQGVPAPWCHCSGRNMVMRQENHEGSLCVTRPGNAAAGPVLQALTQEELMWLPAKGNAFGNGMFSHNCYNQNASKLFIDRFCQAATAVIPPRVRPSTGLHLADSQPACFTNSSIPAGSGTGEGSQHGRG